MNDNEHQENFLDECEVEMQKVEGEPGDGDIGRSQKFIKKKSEIKNGK